jgi:hypothetical protein
MRCKVTIIMKFFHIIIAILLVASSIGVVEAKRGKKTQYGYENENPGFFKTILLDMGSLVEGLFGDIFHTHIQVPAEAKMTPQQLVEGYGYTYVDHKVTTSDGYILSVW